MIKSFFTTTYDIIRNAVLEFIEDDAMTLAGALAFFAIFSIPPVFIIVLSGVALFAGEEVASQELYGQISALWGDRPAKLIQTLIRSYSIESGEKQTIIYQIVGIVTFLVSSSSFFLVIQYSLNRIWNIKPKPKSTLFSILKNRLLSLGIILALIILILLSVILDSFLVLMRKWFDALIPVEELTSLVFEFLGPLLSYLLVTLIVAIIFKYLAHASIKWHVVWLGAGVTSLLFGIGKLVIGVILTNTDVEGTYGIAGSLILVLLWVYYSAIILFYGAEITEQCAISFLKPIRPDKYAVKVVSKEVSIEDDGD